MIGTMFFFVAHVLYCVAFTFGTRVRPSSMLNKGIRMGACVIFLAMLVGNNYMLWPVMPYKLLFTSYSVILCLMNILAVQRY